MESKTNIDMLIKHFFIMTIRHRRALSRQVIAASYRDEVSRQVIATNYRGKLSRQVIAKRYRVVFSALSTHWYHRYFSSQTSDSYICR